MAHAAQLQKYLEKILESKEFESSKIYGTYLTYLVNATNQGKQVKETTIAIEVFGKDYNFNPAEDTIVRTHTYHLRKKLENYYQTDGADDKYRIRIPKGHYEVKFVPTPAGVGILGRYFGKGLLYIGAVCLLGALTVVLAIRNFNLEKSLRQYQIIEKDDPIWHNYLQSKLPILIAIGDHFFFDQYSANYEQLLSIRHGKVNSLADLEQLKARFPGNGLQPTPEPYFPHHSIWSLPPILKLFFSVGQTPILRKSSIISPQILDEYNMIFVGSIKTLYNLEHTLAKSHFWFELVPHKVIYTPSDSSAPQYFSTPLHSSGPNDDLVLALKLPGPVGNSILIIASFHSLGAPEIASYLAQKDTRQKLENLFEEKFGEVPEHFEILFRVTGIDKTAYNTEILVLDKLVVE